MFIIILKFVLIYDEKTQTKPVINPNIPNTYAGTPQI